MLTKQQYRNRKRYTSLKPAKEALRRGKYFAAISLLLDDRDKLLKELEDTPEPFKGQRRQIQEVLALVDHQLSLAYEGVGNEAKADEHSKAAIRYYAGPNKLGFAILLRDDGWRMLGRGKLEEAEQLITQAISIIQVLREPVEKVPRKRINTEYWVARGYLARVMLARGEMRKGVAWLIIVDEELRTGSTKRYRELENLMALIPTVSILERYPLILRAMKLNKEHVHNHGTWIRLASRTPPGLPLPRLVEPYLR